MQVYKVRHKPTGLFWKGGGIPTYRSTPFVQFKGDTDKLNQEVLDQKFSKAGKTWGEYRFVKSAFSQIKFSRRMEDIISECELVTYKCEEIESLDINIL